MPRNTTLFDETISVEEIGGFKSDAKVYHFEAKR